MTGEEIFRLAELSPAKSVCIDSRMTVEFPGLVRRAEIHDGNRCCISYDFYGMDEGGAYFWAKYATFDLLLSALEVFLARPSETWVDVDCSDSYPTRPADLKELSKTGQAALAHAIFELRFPVPHGEFELHGSYWRQHLPTSSS